MTKRHLPTIAKKPVIQIQKGSKMRRFRASLTGDMASLKKNKQNCSVEIATEGDKSQHSMPGSHGI